MRRRAKPAKAKLKAMRPAARKSPKNVDATVRDLERRLAESQAREQATSDVLRIISRSPADLSTVLLTIAETAARVCGASDGVVFLTIGTRLRIMAHHGAIGARGVPLSTGCPCTSRTSRPSRASSPWAWR